MAVLLRDERRRPEEVHGRLPVHRRPRAVRVLILNDDLEQRILAVLPSVKGSWSRQQLLYRLGRHGGEAAAALLTGIVVGEVKAPAGERAMALQGLALAAGESGVPAYRTALSDRDLFVQTLALGILRRHDRSDEASSGVAAWLTRRLKGRARRIVSDFTEVPLAVAYFSAVGDLPQVARILETLDGHLEPVERRVLDIMWPREHRRRWAAGDDTADRPDLSEMGEYGHSHEFYVRVDAEVRGLAPPALLPPSDPEQDAQEAAELDAEFMAELARLERRQERDR